ncbi:hypothetical protein KXV68_009635 [Aspergillus fumigatus]|nr:hypothetical protein KXX13_003955 [Aspergillus fumigatus]KAH1734818.1 hypothetical protein KXX25_002547 [Aspergillus fumigatus]KAH2079565.1 hypothetical protein KXW32_007254 [Aspergillus fumigatus]KAH2149267.1 hypothetical protein KXV68_009635 [Aspergillus fumigatus]KAH2420053.1 hypothetical protein KXV44_007250 [Aspergillus fumigatus]
MYAVPAVDIKDILGYKPSAQCAIFMQESYPAGDPEDNEKRSRLLGIAKLWATSN